MLTYLSSTALSGKKEALERIDRHTHHRRSFQIVSALLLSGPLALLQAPRWPCFPLFISLPRRRIAGVLAAVVLAYYLICYLTAPLKDSSGPRLAKFTNLWRVHDYIHLISPETQKKLHAKHGVVVRLGLDLVALNDPALIPVIYNARGNFRKVRGFPISLAYVLLHRSGPCTRGRTFRLLHCDSSPSC